VFAMKREAWTLWATSQILSKPNFSFGVKRKWGRGRLGWRATSLSEAACQCIGTSRSLSCALAFSKTQPCTTLTDLLQRCVGTHHIPVIHINASSRYNPRPRLDHSSQETAPAYAAHMNTLKAAYGDVLCINLVNGSGDEWVIGSEFFRQVAMARDPAVRHVHFDFHKKCGSSGGNSDNLDPLMDRVRALGGHDLSWSEFEWNDDAGTGGDVTYIQRQRAVLRVNCIDCLDRTNVVQAFFFQKTLLSIINSWEIGPLVGQIIPPQLAWSNLQSLAAVVRIMWFNNGNALSLQYSGTGSLKAEVTKTGKQSLMGLLSDGVKSVRRLYYSYLKDSTRQDMIELLLGHFTLETELEAEGGGDGFVSTNGTCTSFQVVRVTRIGARRSAVLEVRRRV
jgi:hypothetical protein